MIGLISEVEKRQLVETHVRIVCFNVLCACSWGIVRNEKNSLFCSFGEMCGWLDSQNNFGQFWRLKYSCEVFKKRCSLFSWKNDDQH